MSVDVVMPQMGESITEGTVSKWLKAVGDKIEKDEAILEISTDKVDAEVPSPGAGVLLEIRHQEGETVEVGTVVAVIGAEGEQPVAANSGAAAQAEPVAAQISEPQAEEIPAPEILADSAAASGSASSGAPPPETTPSAQSGGHRSSNQEGSSEPAAAGAGPSTEVVMPQMGESITEGTVSKWLKAVGDKIEKDEPLLEISTDKVDAEVPSPAAGRSEARRV